mmetsp:Transcript_15174/g.27448  ORF Transcript_15174/g.27448 Transcript_15174/m.27448 type:complete len:431 (-) Transcript_15174:100-1392(-)|eukprot:CAMPEP_0201624550 /NCGR_PEP_ID=MMETSP0493-20130528/688_1 /ASSEMBLY_ACC=CAM_ASM_000838 /TAXON_ID=420259 /ORGANISM="Thalassiosira gravida, Strain GMp14c1" /LENGTH=430 /DNA_ID=CAMNT_0048094405 /DNA_START=51 /DNA_END=1343 /DNA_ORIENTATION=-
MGGSCDEERSPPLRIVLGAFNDSSTLAKVDYVGPSSSSSSPLPAVVAVAGSNGETSPYLSSSSPTNYILGTSYFATPRLGASPGSGASRRSAMRLNKDGRVPMSDRKFYLDTFKPKALIMSTVRVTAINISTTFSTFFSDQLHSEQLLETMADDGEITPDEADEMNEEWENREWELRKNALPKKIGWALVRFHTCTALMRFYELIMARYVLRVDGDGRGLLLDGNNGAIDPVTTTTTSHLSRGGQNSNPSSLTHEQAITVMDKLTRDPFQASLRTSQVLHNEEHYPGMVIASNGTETPTSRELTKRMFSTCLWANVIPFLAELTVQQLVLVYGYWVYYAAKKRRQTEREGMKDGENEDSGGETQCEEDDATSESAYALALMFRSSRLTIARSMSWIAASAGGGIGCVVYPGWGTVFGIQIGDTLVGALTD